ncbi:hypothetical protein [Patulibacter defluvii]|uniref:hypothetical protein n=1 Tax=Patulibacter defluvii TaxID=3095358 RepID=UPI002A74E21D|nr:hypothetical protein [Patulibacter sp. DM4]
MTGPASAGDNDQIISAEWLANTLSRGLKLGQVDNNTIPGAIERRDRAKTEWKTAVAKYKTAYANAAKQTGAARTAAIAEAKKLYPDPKAKPEYSLVWSGKQNVADINADVISKLIQNLTVNPQGLLEMLGPQFLPGLDGWQVIDVRKQDVSGKANPDYGKVVNFVQLPLPWGVENEPHHMQYEWEDGDPVIAGALFVSTTHVLDVSDIPNVKLKNQVPLTGVGYSIPDAYDAVGDGRFIGTYMGGPITNFGGSPGALAVFKPDPNLGLVVENVVPAGNTFGTAIGNANGVPEPCSGRESRPLGTCANPHGIQVRPDLKTVVTSDYAEPREIVLDPVKTLDKYAFRPTVRTFDLTNPGAPVLKSVSHMPKGWREPVQRAHENYGIMENAKTWPKTAAFPQTLESKGAFAGSMCGGGIFFTPDITKLKGDASDKWVQVWDDGLSDLLSKGDGDASKFIDQPGDCAGGAWHQVSRNNKWFFRSVQGRNPGGDNYFDRGATKQLYDLNIEDLIKSAQDGKVQCDLTNGIDTDGDGSKDLTAIQAVHKLAKGEKVADCPTLIDTLKVNDNTSGGPHWAALDNHSYTPDGFPTRLTFSNYFVSRTGVDGDHRFYLVNIDKDGKLSYDEDFRDEKTGALGVNFNRRNWPGSPDAGFYKPHSMLWITPPGIAPKNTGPLPVLPDDPAPAPAVAVGGEASAVRALAGKRSKASVRVKVTGAKLSRVKVVVRNARKRALAASKARTISAGKKVKVTLSRASRSGWAKRSKVTVTVTGRTPEGKSVSVRRSVRL